MEIKEETEEQKYITKLHNGLENGISWKVKSFLYTLNYQTVFNQLLNITSAQQEHEMVEYIVEEKPGFLQILQM